MKTITEITEILENMPDGELRDLWNDYQMECRGERMIFDFDDFFFEKHFSSPAEAARAVYFGEIENWNAAYVCFNGAGNIEASDSLITLISVYDLANEIERNRDNYTDLLDEDTDDE